jgi:hypothetical protein
MRSPPVRQLINLLAAIGLVPGSIACSGDNATGPSAETTLESVIPGADATGVDPSGMITVRFSGPMASGMDRYVDLHQGDISGPVVPMPCALSADRSAVICTPDQPLQPGTTYTIHMGAGMMDANGRPVETESHGMGLGGQPVTGQMMGGMHDGEPTGMMGSGWRHPGDGHLGMAFTFETA